MFNQIGYLINALLEVITLHLYAKTLFIQKRSKYAQYVSLILFSVSIYFLADIPSSWLYTVIFILFSFSYISIIYQLKWYVSMLHVIILLSSKTMIAIIVWKSINQFYLCEWGTRIVTLTDLLYTLLKQILYFLTIVMITHILQSRHQKEEQLKFLYQKEVDNARYYRTLAEQTENHRRLIHDMRNHLATINTLNENNETEKIRDYIKSLHDFGKLNTSVQRSDNHLLNAILCRFSGQCENMQIAFYTDIRNHTLDFLSDPDMTILIGNLLDNAVYAANTAPNASIELTIFKKENAPISVLSMINSCSQAPVINSRGSFISLKSNSMLHGIGLKNVQTIVKKYNGIMKTNYNSEDKTFHTIVTLQNPQMQSE